MKKIINKDTEVVDIDNIDKYAPIFVKEGDKFHGMIVKEEAGWIVRVGADFGSYGYHDTLRQCIEEGMEHGFEFYIEEVE